MRGSVANIQMLEEAERKVLWLACWMIHHANHIRPSRDGLKVGGHQSSSASAVTILTALYMHALRPHDRVAVKPHASPVYHAIQYLLGHQDRDRLKQFRGFGGAQSYPSRTKDLPDVDFSTGSVGLGVGITLFASLVQDYVRLHGFSEQPVGRMVAVLGDAELDEGNVFEALLEGWKHEVRNLWWIIDYNRHSLDGVVNDALFQRIREFFVNVGWEVVSLKYGRQLSAAFEGPAGEALKKWIDDCPNQLYSALTFKGGGAWRAELKSALRGTSRIAEFLDTYDDQGLQDLMTNLGGHDMGALVEAFDGATSEQPYCFIAYTIKGHRLPLAGHKDNHAGLMTPAQMEVFQAATGVPKDAEWDAGAGLRCEPNAFRDFIRSVPLARPTGSARADRVSVDEIALPAGDTLSTQDAFGKIMTELGRANGRGVAKRVVTTSPDVTVSTNLAGWVNRRGVFARSPVPDTFREQAVASPLKWEKRQQGQHIELGIAENNLFLLLAAAGLSHSLFGARLLPVGTLYDPFISRGLDALNYGCYQDARFILAATPSGISLAPEGGAHQSIAAPLNGIAQDGLASFEPAFADELAVIMGWAFDYIQRDGSGQSSTNWLRDTEGGAVYLRLSTRPLVQPERTVTDELRQAIIDGGYWASPPGPDTMLVIAYTGAVVPEATDAHRQILDEIPGAGLLAVTSADRLNAGWHAAEAARQEGRLNAQAHVERLLAAVPRDARIVTVTDGHPLALSWLGSVHGHRLRALGVEHFGQSGDIPDLFEHYRIDSAAILDACAAACLDRIRPVRAVS